MLAIHPRHRSGLQAQQGFMLLEVLVAILIFAVGILGLVGLQANAVQQSGMAKARADASLLANELVGQMWSGPRDFATLQAQFDSDNAGAGYAAWRARVAATLPQVGTYAPIVDVQQVNPLPASAPGVGITASSRITITVRWRMPSDTTADPVRNYTMVTEIR
ncbi:type IV pilus modification protein PilV [Inhella crocodyli]|uniref:Type IV pilus modification protein PilV n=1 Tax=Inhella crocodyli TaxID=2499851 RepID=A0A3S2V1X8_9BURK|nr:type IV pilus modification protein PilV [Inhella crocodyli]RVT86346.1 type IV pilus modification protein PilV [Inhella crocodyli]